MASPGVTVSFDGLGLRLDTSEDAQTICDEMAGKEVEILILQGNTFGIEAAERVGQELAKQPSLREAHFKDLFTSRGREEVPYALGHLLKGICDSGAKLTLLDLSDNAIGPIGAPAVIEFMETAEVDSIEKFYVHNCGWGPDGSTTLASIIPKLKSLREFVCGRSRLENQGASNMSRALSELNSIEVLKLNQNGIRPDGIEKLVDAIMTSLDCLRVIDLSDNTIKAEGAEALSRFISQAPNLRCIRLDDCLLENEGFSIICDALSKSPSFDHMDQLACEGNELHGQKIVDLIDLTFSTCRKEFCLNLLENDFTPAELTRLEAMRDDFDILVDEIDDDDDNDDDNHDHDGSETDNQDEVDDREEGEISDDGEDDDDDDNDSGDLNGYVDLSNCRSDMREVSQDFVQTTSEDPTNSDKINSAFLQMISVGKSSTEEKDFENVQILCEELGLMKLEETRKKKPLAQDAIIYIGKRCNELPPTFKSFFEVVVKNNDDLGCGKILFEKLEI